MMHRHSSGTVVGGFLLLLCLVFPAVLPAAQTSVLWDNDILLRAVREGNPGSSSLWIRVLSGSLPIDGSIDALVPGTDDAAYDGQAVVAMQAAEELDDQRLAVVWVREDPFSGNRDLAIAWMNLPSWEGMPQWLTRDDSTPQNPRLIVHSEGTHHVIFRRAEDGHLIYLLRTRDGRSRHEVDVSEKALGGLGVVQDSYDFALIGDEIIVAAVPDDNSGRVIVAANGDLPTGGDWLPPVPLLRNSRELTSSGGAYQYDPLDGVPQPEIHNVQGLPLVTWTLQDSLLETSTFFYRHRNESGVWSDWARMAIDMDFDEAGALEVVRGLLTRDPNDGKGIDPMTGFPGAEEYNEEGPDTVTRAEDGRTPGR